MLILQGVAYAHPNREILFNDIDLVINKQDKIALIGNNGAGKSTLLQIMAGRLQPTQGLVKTDAVPYYVPQLFGQYNGLSIANALGVENKLTALQEILSGNVTEANMALLDDDWAIEERCHEALAYWKLDELNLHAPMGTLSGGQKTKVFLAGIMVHKPQIILLDEPSNHLDSLSRDILYSYVHACRDTLVVVSHDRVLLNLPGTVCELGKQEITVYGGNYAFYREQKMIEEHAFREGLKDKEKELRKAKVIERETLERQQKADARGKRKQEQAGLPTISMNTFRNNAEKSTARIKDVHAGKVAAIAGELSKLRKDLPGNDKMKVGFNDTALHTGKVLIAAKDIDLGYGDGLLWKRPLSFIVTSGERIVIRGANGAGKTTLAKMMLNEIQPQQGTITRADVRAVYIDQDYSLVDNGLSVYEQAQLFNPGELDEHEVKSRLTHFLFTKEFWDRACGVLSGGEKMRLVLCCLTIGKQAPDMMVLDEPTNNLDIQNAEILTAAINEYKGTVIVISHDAYFLEQVKIEKAIWLDS